MATSKHSTPIDWGKIIPTLAPLVTGAVIVAVVALVGEG